MPGTRSFERAASRAPSAVKDAYAAWLSQLNGDDAADKVLATLQPRRRHRSRAEQIAQVEHAQQSTAASSLKRSAVALAVDSDCVNGASQNECDGARLPAIKIDKAASLRRRRQALVDQASYAALNSYSSDLAPGLAFLMRLADAAAAGSPPFRPTPATAFDANATHSVGVHVRDCELPNFPVRIVPTLLRVRSRQQYRSRRSKEPVRQCRWSMALLLCRDPSESDDDSSPLSVVRAAAPSSRASGQSSKPQSGNPSFLTLHVRLYVPSSQPEHSSVNALSSESRRALVRTLLSAWVSSSGAGFYGGGVRAVCKHRELLSDGRARRPPGTASRLLRTAEEVEKAVDALCEDSAVSMNATDILRDPREMGNIRESKRNDRDGDNNSHDGDDVAQGQHGDTIDAVQPYIPSRSSLHAASTNFVSGGSAFAPERSAWIARCSFRKKEKNPSTVWISSGGGEKADTSSENEPAVAMTVDEQSDSCQIVKCSSSQSWTEPRLLTAALAPELERILRVSFKELVVDFVQGSNGSWWLLQVKAFELRQQDRASGLNAGCDTAGSRRTKSAPDRLTTAVAYFVQRYRKWRCAGRYCDSSSPSGELSPLPEDSTTEPSGFLSLKAVRSCEFVDDYYCRRDMSLVGGFESFSTALAFHLQHELPKREARQLYESQPLCSACMRRYYQLREQLDQTMMQESKVDAAVGARGSSKISAMAKAARRSVSTGKLNPARPRVLPALQSDGVGSAGTSSIYASVSAPDLMPPPRGRMNNAVQRNDQPHRSYLDELAAMEKMLALPLETNIPTKETQEFSNGAPEAQRASSEKEGKTTSKGNEPSGDVYSRIFSPEGQQRRLDAMWQSVAPKSLEVNTAEQPKEQHDCAKQTYNTFSLSSELRRLDEVAEGSNSTQPAPTAITKSTITNMRQSIASMTPHTSQKTHQIRLTDCRSVFSDDEVRDRIVQEAIDAIVDIGERVCFIVMPSQGEETDAQLPDIALRSLFLDVKEGVARGSVSRTLTATPQILHETSGCVTMTI